MTNTYKLHLVKDLIGTPEQWTKGAAARDADGEIVDFDSNEAVKFCLVGACCRVARDYRPNVIDRYIQKAIGQYDIQAIENYNDDDSRTHDEVMATMNKAITLAMQEANT